MSQIGFWVVKCREKLAYGGKGWHWRKYLGDSKAGAGRDFAFGGSRWIRSPASLKHIAEDVREGDIALCYQTDEKAILGITRMASDGEAEEEGSGTFNVFNLIPARKAVRLDPPILISELRAGGCDPGCFGPGTQGTIFPLTRDEWTDFLKVLLRLRPGLAWPTWMQPEEQPPAFMLNSNEKYRPHGTWREMLTKGVACTSGSIECGRYLLKLRRGSRLFLYVNKIGVVAEGLVESEWSGRANRPPIVWKLGPEYHEYSVAVRWIRQVSEREAVTVAELKSIGVTHFRKTLSGLSPSMADEISARLPNGASRELPPQPPLEPGGGFGSSEQNRKVELAAMKVARKTFEGRGWKVKSVEPERCGYDLLCTCGRKTLHVEVKGTSGDSASFVITANEVQTAKQDELSRVFVVLKALSAKKSSLELTGKEFLRQYQLSPIQYKATPKR